MPVTVTEFLEVVQEEGRSRASEGPSQEVKGEGRKKATAGPSERPREVKGMVQGRDFLGRFSWVPAGQAGLTP